MHDALFDALRAGDRAAVDALVPSGPVALAGELSALMVAAAAGHADLAAHLLARGADPRERRGNADLLTFQPTTVLLSRGVDLVLQVPRATVDAVRARGPEVQVLQSVELVAAYNRLAAKERVVALLHSTC